LRCLAYTTCSHAGQCCCCAPRRNRSAVDSHRNTGLLLDMNTCIWNTMESKLEEKRNERKNDATRRRDPQINSNEAHIHTQRTRSQIGTAQAQYKGLADTPTPHVWNMVGNSLQTLLFSMISKIASTLGSSSTETWSTTPIPGFPPPVSRLARSECGVSSSALSTTLTAAGPCLFLPSYCCLPCCDPHRLPL